MEWILAGLAIVVLAAAAMVGSGRWGEMPPVVDDRYPGMVPDGTLTGDDLRATRFKVVPRGYSMTQVDELLARLTQQLDRGAAASAAAVDDTSAGGRFVPGADADPVAAPGGRPEQVVGPGGADGVRAGVPGQAPAESARDEHRSL